MSGSIHGGSFWQVTGNDLNRLAGVVQADVLDAWFPPAPGVLEAMWRFPTELCNTSPEVDARPLRRAISRVRGIPEDSILTGAGSSALIFLALPILTRACCSATILDPMYGEYRHVLEKLCRLEINAVGLTRSDGYALDCQRLLDAPGDIVAIVNPNSPTGKHVDRRRLAPVVEELAKTRLVWVDETYIEYVGGHESLESLALTNANVIVVKSMSKVYALSGLRVGYLVSHPDRVASLVRFQAPWPVSLPAQVCAECALEDPGYYDARYAETATLRGELRRGFTESGFEVTEGSINAMLLHLPERGPTAAEVVAALAAKGIYVRDAGSMGSSMGDRTLRISVRNSHENARLIAEFEVVRRWEPMAATRT